MYLTNKLHEMYLDWRYPDRPHEDPMNIEFQGRINNHKLICAYSDGRSIPRNACFCIYDSDWWCSSTKVSIISFLKPEYGFRPHMFSLFEWNRWYLDKCEKEELIDYLSSTKSGTSDTMTNWEDLVYCYNKGHTWGHIWENSTLTNGRVLHPDYLPEDLPMPDYRLLPEKKKWF